jgi:WD40 repeat protein
MNVKKDGHNYVLHFDCNNSNEYISSGSMNKYLCIWEKNFGYLIAKLNGHNNTIDSIKFNPVFNNFFVSISDDFSIKLWNLNK